MILLDNQLSRDVANLATKDEAILIIDKLEWELKNSKITGVGLAAPQIGINKAVAIVRVPNSDPTNPIVCVNLVNPVMLDGYDLVQYNEGCLSFPGMSTKTIRYNEITIETMNDYEYYAEQINAKRYKREAEQKFLLKDERIRLGFGEAETGKDPVGRLVCICVQHEFSHLLGLTMFDFKPEEIGRNDQCPCGAGKKNKKCHNYSHYNEKLEKLFNPKYRSV